MIVEALIISMLMLSGLLILNSFGLKNWGLVPLGFFCGTAAFTVISYVISITGLVLNPLVPILLLLLVSLLLRGYVQYKNPSKPPLVIGLVGVGAILAIVLFFYNVSLYKFHYDSVRYLIVGSLIHYGHLNVISDNLLDKRFSSVSILHSLGHFSGNFYLRSITPMFGISILASIVWFIKYGFESLPNKKIALFSSLPLLFLLSGSPFVLHSFYINGHLFTGAYLLLAGGAGWLLAVKSRIPASALFAVVALASAGLVMTRVEGFLYAIVAILPTVLNSNLKLSHRRILLVSTGLFIVLEEVNSVYYRLLQSDSIPNRSKEQIFLGVCVIAANWFLSLKILQNRHKHLLWLSELGLWGALGLLFLTNPSILLKSIWATTQNIVFVLSPWGYFLIMLIVLTVISMIFYKFKDRTVLRFTVSSFLPLVFIIGYLREGAYRVSPNDSLNRMLIQIVPLAVLYIAVSAIYAAAPAAKRVRKSS